jgi:hypothetical protein
MENNYKCNNEDGLFTQGKLLYLADDGTLKPLKPTKENESKKEYLFAPDPNNPEHNLIDDLPIYNDNEPNEFGMYEFIPRNDVDTDEPKPISIYGFKDGKLIMDEAIVKYFFDLTKGCYKQTECDINGDEYSSKAMEFYEMIMDCYNLKIGTKL